MQNNENCGVLKRIIIARQHMPTWWVVCDFSDVIAFEFSDKMCDCCTLLLFICQAWSVTRLVNLGFPKAFIQLFYMQVHIPYIQFLITHSQTICSKVRECNLKDHNPDAQN